MVAAKRHGVGFLEGCNIPNENVVPIDVGLVCFIIHFTLGKPPKLNHNSLAHHHDEALNPKPYSCGLIMGDGLQLVPDGSQMAPGGSTGSHMVPCSPRWFQIEVRDGSTWVHLVSVES